jgi:hypothetical protein
MKRLNVLVVLLCLILVNYGLAYDDRTTHPQITEAVIVKSALNDYLIDFLGLPW